MHKILIIGVNYNSLASAEKYIESVLEATVKLKGLLKLQIVIADNSEKEKRIKAYKKIKGIHLEQIFTNSNLGYMGAVEYVIDILNVDLPTFDYVVISNVDVWVHQDFFINLSKVKGEGIGMLAPGIFSYFEKKDRNPKLISRYSKKKLLFLKFLYKFPVLFKLYNNLALKYGGASEIIKDGTEIYAGHGSFMIFSKLYFSTGGSYRYPCFLFGEEIFFAEENCRLGLKILYNKSLKVYDSDHVSTSRMKTNQITKFNYIAINYILKNYY